MITAAGKEQRNLPMQTLFDQQGQERSVLSLVVREAVRAGINEMCIVVWPGDEEPYARLLADDGARLTFIPQTEARGYAHAVLCAREFVKDEPFLHFVGDHIYVGAEASGSAKTTGGSSPARRLRHFSGAGDAREPASALRHGRRPAGAGQAGDVSRGNSARKADADRSGAAPDRSRPAQRAVSLLLRNARAHAGDF